jgi:hypothetical protein
MKKIALSLALVGLLAFGGRAMALICTIDAVPAATLLLPYFEVDLNNPNGLTTLFSINNASATAILAHVTVWTDLSMLALDFEVYLTGYDVQTINLRDIIVNGFLPQTADFQDDPGDKISPKGPLSQDISFPGCRGVLPPPVLSAFFLTHLQAALTGNGDPFVGGLCEAQNLGDNIARGYITVDTVNACTLLSPGDNGYFAQGGTGIATNQNVLWGDWTIVNATQNFAEGGDLVHIEAAPGSGTRAGGFGAGDGPPGSGGYGFNPATVTPGRYTFYGRDTGPITNTFRADDNREPLATTFATRFLNGGTFSGGTSLLVWRDSKLNQLQDPAMAPFNCPAVSGRPPWYPLGEEGILIFDEQEHPALPTIQPVSPQPPGLTLTPFPAETQRTKVNGSTLPVPFPFGWLYLDLNTTIGVTDASNKPDVDPAADQAYVIATLEANGHFAVGIDAIRLDSACAANHFVP